MRKIINILVSLAISIILSVVLMYGITNYTNLIKFCGIGSLIVSSGSMEPELSIGDIIIIKECANYEVGDIITYNVEDKYFVTHRIVDKEGNDFVTKGDNNNVKDNQIVLKENIEGKVILNAKLLRVMYEHYILIVSAIILLLIIL
ncbi:MAG: signal peptidase I [Bacilli bacterium]|nr:signal peptidase I [Bacilli bacterium]